MKVIDNGEFGGERPFFAEHDLELRNTVIGAGESALKRCSDILAVGCRFEGKYPFWHTDRFRVEDCEFTVGARAALWYSTGCVMKNCKVDAPKMFREMDGIEVEDTAFPDGEEMLWHCRNVVLNRVRIEKCDYLFMHSENIRITDYEQHGNYSFQYCRNVVIDNARIFSKDAFWNTDDVTVRDSELHGEYLGWHSRGLTLINCHITGTQPLCYVRDLKLINCTFGDDADLAFEESVLDAEIASPVVSIKNPTSGRIVVPSVGEIIIDKNIQAPADCKIEIEEKAR